MYLYLTTVCAFIHAASSISVASTPSPYTSQPTDSSYISPTTIEPATDYKLNNQYPYSRQFFEPLFTPNNQYAETLSSPSPVTPKQLFHRFPFFPSLSPYGQQPYGQQPYAQQPYAQQPYAQQPYAQQPYAQPPSYDLPYGQPPYNAPRYPNQALLDPHYPLMYPQKYAKHPFLPDCDYHPPSYRNTKPILFYPNKPDPYLDSQILAKPSNSLFRFQPPPYGANYANNIYH